MSSITVFYCLEGEDLYISMYFLEWVGLGDCSKYTVETFVLAELGEFQQL